MAVRVRYASPDPDRHAIIWEIHMSLLQNS